MQNSIGMADEQYLLGLLCTLFSSIPLIANYCSMYRCTLSNGCLNENGLLSLGFTYTDRTIRLDDNNISTILPYTFCNFGMVEVLVLTGNNLNQLDQFMFKGLDNLLELYLDNNNISLLTPYWSANLNNVYSLDLSVNQLAKLNSGDFKGMSSLVQLTLTGNSIFSVNSMAFDGLNSLVYLDLSANQLTAFSPDSLAPLRSRLQVLLLDNNDLTSIAFNQFQNMTELTVVTLYANYLPSNTQFNLTGLDPGLLINI